MIPDAELRGLAYITCSSLLIVVMSSIIKIVTLTIPPLEVSVLRSLLSIPFFLFVLPRSETFNLRFFLTKEHFLRSLFGYSSFVTLVLCISTLPLAAVSAIFYTTPIWSFLLSVFVLKERQGVTPIIGLTFGLLGMLAIIQPSAINMSIWIVIGLLGAALGSLTVMMIRRISGTEAPERIALSFMLWSSAMGLPLAIPRWVWPTWDVWPSLFLIGTLGMLAQVALTRGYTLARLVAGAPFDFIRLPASLTVGWICFAEFPTPLMWLGVVLVLLGSSIALAERYFDS
ncbi:drug/metabolite transporter (DMT)-like permease [Bradyrhizobium sp. IAR9]|uniref:DMT family transporter n=1 Tax=Bradyrhizobium sp. IAR9 TaxID=2663841 RepID=UPI0015C844C3|nr:DMT family transporter [Bradyrhizobium sp. IAR9]NYG45492.1 drug/metabolite transporter (DMT)-like permease [Bradyrhizobium sp. IAR9]